MYPLDSRAIIFPAAAEAHKLPQQPEDKKSPIRDTPPFSIPNPDDHAVKPNQNVRIVIPDSARNRLRLPNHQHSTKQHPLQAEFSRWRFEFR